MQACESINGWVFQTAAGIKLFLENINKIKSMKMEGKKEDIELTFYDDFKIYAQAKSVYDINNKNTLTKHLKNALNSLSKIKDENCELIYICNMPNPLNSKQVRHYDYSCLKYKDIIDKDKKLILKYTNNDFPYEKFKLINFKFIQDDKYKNIKKIIELFLHNCDIETFYYNKILNTLFLVFVTNCTEKIKQISKNEFLYYIANDVCTIISEEKYNKVCIHDLYTRAKKRYIDIIEESILDYELYLKVITEKNKYPKMSKVMFVVNYWEEYKINFDSISNDKDKESVTKIFMYTILTNDTKIENIQKETEYDNRKIRI